MVFGGPIHNEEHPATPPVFESVCVKGSLGLNYLNILMLTSARTFLSCNVLQLSR